MSRVMHVPMLLMFVLFAAGFAWSGFFVVGMAFGAGAFVTVCCVAYNERQKAQR